jgi:hypothetical protein
VSDPMRSAPCTWRKVSVRTMSSSDRMSCKGRGEAGQGRLGEAQGAGAAGRQAGGRAGRWVGGCAGGRVGRRAAFPGIRAPHPAVAHLAALRNHDLLEGLAHDITGSQKYLGGMWQRDDAAGAGHRPAPRARLAPRLEARPRKGAARARVLQVLRGGSAGWACATPSGWRPLAQATHPPTGAGRCAWAPAFLPAQGRGPGYVWALWRDAHKLWTRLGGAGRQRIGGVWVLSDCLDRHLRGRLGHRVGARLEGLVDAVACDNGGKGQVI